MKDKYTLYLSCPAMNLIGGVYVGKPNVNAKSYITLNVHVKYNIYKMMMMFYTGGFTKNSCIQFI